MTMEVRGRERRKKPHKLLQTDKKTAKWTGKTKKKKKTACTNRQTVVVGEVLPVTVSYYIQRPAVTRQGGERRGKAAVRTRAREQTKERAATDYYGLVVYVWSELVRDENLQKLSGRKALWQSQSIGKREAAPRPGGGSKTHQSGRHIPYRVDGQSELGHVGRRQQGKISSPRN